MIKAGLNIGNSKISCIVCDYKSSEKLKILSLINKTDSMCHRTGMKVDGLPQEPSVTQNV